ncbi:hypothetical protein KKD49_03245, partial [Myxococcota bacterium]|nr:hypothetical protein [Myxococcota bacterium]
MRLKAIYITLFLLFTGCSSSNNKTTPPETGKDDVKSTPHTRPSYSSNPCSIDNRKVKEDIENGKPYIIIQRHPEETGIKVTYKNIRNIRFTADVNSENNNWRITFDDKPALNSILSIKCFYKQKQEFSTALQKEYINRKKIITRLKSFSKLLKIGNPQNIKSEAMKISTDFKQLSVTDFVYPEITSDGTNIKINENCEVYNTGLNIIDEDFKKISKCLEQNFIPDLENKMKTFKKSFCGEYNFSLDKYTNKIVCSKRSFSKVSFKNDEKKIDRDMIKFTSGLVFSDTYCNGENLFRYIGVNNLKNNCYTAAIIPFLASFAPFGGHRNAGEDLDGFWNNLKYRFKIDIGIGIKSIFQKPDP